MSISHHCIGNLSCLNFRIYIYMYAVQLFMYKRHHDKLPCIFRGLFFVNYEVVQRIFRQSELLCMPDGKSSARRRTIVFSGVSLHNYFSHLISFNCSIVTYKRELKKHFNTSYNLPDVPKWWRNHYPVFLFVFWCCFFVFVFVFPCFLLFYFSITPALFRTTLFVA